ncbi:Spermine/spermidine synthase-domain-containing protein [Fimicolochytrium jonesii]|uniref:Spermine/spermidine synthase-domain-containing protein n=1 Tax=Fimicolochytrium jonesii TaxID=1396493 RepID=UPI0022FE1B08|nr:Spermine/spermidine synthase-domain-containing protein [Fimicolochytrium jonesii]KAI8816271.1 Spermine/spermidine synthase-domain-containing protein [Fimicolochytrium jonesii]
MLQGKPDCCLAQQRRIRKQEMSHPNIKDGWFKESQALWPGQAMTLQVKEILHQEKSQFQDVLVFQSTNHGNVLVLDGVIQATERDEFSYQEMIAHLPLNAHANPKKVLVIGGGDGGVLREIVKHDCVEEVTLVEIDEAVVKASKKFLPAMAVGFQHPKVKLHIGDGFAYLKENENTYDVIITDSSDPVGPAESLFGETFYDLMRKALLPGGIICTQGECQWLHLPLIRSVLTHARTIFPVAEYAWASVPTYPCGNMGFILCSNEPGKDLKTPARYFERSVEDKKLRYYNREVHSAAFVLPQFAKAALEV